MESCIIEGGMRDGKERVQESKRERQQFNTNKNKKKGNRKKHDKVRQKERQQSTTWLEAAAERTQQ
jgi:hypothetical protein